jgi:membrane associated rhomboid family serine protease
MVLIAFRNVFGKGNAIRLVIYIILVSTASMTNTDIDHMAHIGGLLAGVILGIVLVLVPKMINTHKQVDRYED